jgi:integrase
MARGSIKPHDGPRGRVWRATVDAGKRPNGSRHQLRRSFQTRKAAQTWLAQTIAAADARAAGEPSREPLGDYLARWLDTLRHSGIKPVTEYRYRLVADKRFPDLLAVPLRDLTTARIEAQYAKLAGDPAGALAPRTIAQAHACLRRALDAAVRLGELRANPCLGAKLPTQRRYHPTTWTADQARRFLAAAGEDLYGIYWRLSLETMAREGELTALRWEAVDLDGRCLTVRETRTADRVGRQAIGPPKSEAGRRTIELAAETVKVLRRYRADQEERRRRDPAWNAAGYLFPNRCGGSINSAQVGKRLHKACAKLGLPRLRPHDLRHSAATLAIADGVPLKTVSERLGHRDVRTTISLYVHPDREQHRAAAEQIARIFRPAKPSRARSVTRTPRALPKNRTAKPRIES